MAIQTTNPATGDVVKTFDPHDADEVERRIQMTHDAFLKLKSTDFAIRRDWMNQAAALMEDEIEDVAALLTLEMGKTLEQARAEIAKSATTMRFYADRAEEYLTGSALEEPDAVGAKKAYTRYQPLGVVLAVMPWNYPIWQVVRFAAPALMAGNTVLLKHASNVPQAALYLDTLFHRGGFPEGAFRSLLIPASRVEAVVRDERVAAVTLTGSEPAGRSIASIAGFEVKHSVLELGGSDPFIVMPSADLDAAVATAVESRTINNGQACINAKRFIVHADIHDEFLKRFGRSMSALRMGDPTQATTDLGPLATASGREDIHELVSDARTQGAQIHVGGEVPEGGGWYYPATVVSGVTPEMRLYAEEAFGPVATVFKADDAKDALRIANDTTFGLSSAVWTQDEQDVEFFTSGLDVGAVFVNGMSVSYPELPFGGVKDSGIGRELSAEGIREFCNLKSVWQA